MNTPIKLLIVDDSALMRKVLCNIFAPVKGIVIVGTAHDGIDALKKIKENRPDVVILDINMPQMDGLTTLKHIMINQPLPTLMFSTLTQNGAQVTFNALKYGAVDFIHKPSNFHSSSVEDQAGLIINKVMKAADVAIRAVRYTRTRQTGPTQFNPDSHSRPCEYICAMGAAEGGYGTLLKIIPNIRPDLPMAFIVMLHESSTHMDSFTTYLDRNSPCCVKRAIEGHRVRSGYVYMASSEESLSLDQSDGEYFLRVQYEAGNPGKRRSIDQLMISLSQNGAESAVGVVLSGSGRDGTEGLRAIMDHGGTAIVQAPPTCLHKEMCQNAIQNRAIDLMLPDHKIAQEINASFFL